MSSRLSAALGCVRRRLWPARWRIQIKRTRECVVPTYRPRSAWTHPRPTLRRCIARRCRCFLAASRCFEDFFYFLCDTHWAIVWCAGRAFAQQSTTARINREIGLAALTHGMFYYFSVAVIHIEADRVFSRRRDSHSPCERAVERNEIWTKKYLAQIIHKSRYRTLIFERNWLKNLKINFLCFRLEKNHHHEAKACLSLTLCVF